MLGEVEGDRKGNEIREIGDKTMIEQLKQALQLANEEREKFEAMHEEAERLAIAESKRWKRWQDDLKIKREQIRNEIIDMPSSVGIASRMRCSVYCSINQRRLLLRQLLFASIRVFALLDLTVNCVDSTQFTPDRRIIGHANGQLFE